MRTALILTLAAATVPVLTTPAQAAPLPRVAVTAAHEDGSGVVIWQIRGRGWAGIRLGEGVLRWDCTENGNRICGPTAPSEVRGPSCGTFVLTATPQRRLTDSLAVTYCTTGRTSVRRATDEDAEGEVL